jgi:ferric-dicitrate binding protein FerR (iron transport regulator)
MHKNAKEILSGFIAGEACTEDELKTLGKWLENSEEQTEIDNLLCSEWENSHTMETESDFQEVIKRIGEEDSKKNKVKMMFGQISANFQKVAAILLLPLLIFSGYLILNRTQSETVWFQTFVARGQKSQLILPDGTQVWINSDSKISYPNNYGKKNRSVRLTGEAMFKVAKDAHKPFLVEAGVAKVKVLGTTFNIKSYPEENEIETSLIEGSVEFSIQPENPESSAKTLKIKPGERLVYNKTKKSLVINSFDHKEISDWTKNQLVFRNDSFENLVKKAERWYNIDIVYNDATLDKQRLTVEMHPNEPLAHLLEIIELTMNVECVHENDTVTIITRKK